MGFLEAKKGCCDLVVERKGAGRQRSERSWRRVAWAISLRGSGQSRACRGRGHTCALRVGGCRRGEKGLKMWQKKETRKKSKDRIRCKKGYQATKVDGCVQKGGQVRRVKKKGQIVAIPESCSCTPRTALMHIAFPVLSPRFLVASPLCKGRSSTASPLRKKCLVITFSAIKADHLFVGYATTIVVLYSKKNGSKTCSTSFEVLGKTAEDQDPVVQRNQSTLTKKEQQHTTFQEDKKVGCDPKNRRVFQGS